MLAKLFEKLIPHSPGTIDKSNSSHTPHDFKLAACVLLLEIANSDDTFSLDEQQMIHDILKQQFNLSDTDIQSIITEAEKQRQQSIDIWTFTNQLNISLDKEQKFQFMKDIWKVVFADGVLHGHEDYLVHKLANLLRFSHADLIRAKLAVKNASSRREVAS